MESQLRASFFSMMSNVQDDIVASCSTEMMDVPSHEVFISFRGEDTRKSFTSHLHDALCRKGVKVFIDNELKRGEEISSSLVKAIAESRLSIIVFSKHYATSRWCLDELVNILHYKKSRGQMVRPIFVDVNPREVRNQTEEFAEALASHEKKEKNRGKVQGWRAALKEAANLSGWHLQNQIESEFIQRIVEEVYSKLNRPVLHIAEHPVGLDPQVQAVHTLLNIGANDKRMLAIHGVGGIGKTTIARAVYNMVANEFEGSCFLVNVGEMSKKYGSFWLQETLLREVVGEKSLKIVYNYIGRELIKEKLSHKKVLVVLDGVDHLDDLDELAGEKDWFGVGSRIIITTREALLLDRVDDIYQVKELEQVDALQLFSWKAFKEPHPPSDEHRVFSKQFISLVKGIPLALIVLGSFLFNKTIKEWKDVREKLMDMPSENINQVVKMSFDGLEKNEESIFLDIACFFQGHDIDFVIKLFDRCNFHPERGIKKLLNMSLIYLEFKKVWMHEIIQQFGKEFVCQESPADPGRRSRLWYHHDILQALKQAAVNHVTEAIMLDCPGAEEELRRNNGIQKFKNLRILTVQDAYFSGCPGYLSKDLKWLGGNDFSSPRAMVIRHDANFSGCSMHRGCFQGETNLKHWPKVSKKAARKLVQLVVGPLVIQIKSLNKRCFVRCKPIREPGCFQGVSCMRCTAIALTKAAGKSIQLLAGTLGGQTGCFQGETNLKCLLMVSKRAARKLMQLVVGPLGSQIPSLYKRCFVRLKTIRERGPSWQLHNDMKLCREFSFLQIQCATNNFHPGNLIGEGGSGCVYMAQFEQGRVAAVKRIRSDAQYSYRCMLNELNIQGRLHHKNIVPLLGYFIDDKEIILVMEYMSNGSLRQLLDGHGFTLSWFQRIKVALDIAWGIEYLHVFTDPPIICRDVKTSNILLDDNFTAKLADFGISVETEQAAYEDAVQGTMGYLCPDYCATKELTTRCDVYGFGVVVLELLTGHKAYFMDHNGSYRTLVDMEQRWKEQIDFLDKRIPLPEGLEMEATMLVRALARECLTRRCRRRPSMSQVVRRLEGVLEKCQPEEADTGSGCSRYPDSNIPSPCFSIISSPTSELDNALMYLI